MITLDEINYEFASVQIKDAAGDALAIGADGSLNVTDNGGSLTVDAVDLDIRNLVFADDKVDVSGSEVSLDSATLAALESITVQNGAGAAAVNIQDGGNSITVDGSVSITGDVNVTQGTSPWVVSATDLDIRNLVFADDKVDVSGSEVSLDSATLAALENITVSASDLDIRALNGIYDAGTNPNPDNVGIVAFVRGEEPGLDGQTKQLTASGAGDTSSAGDIRALDTNAFILALNNTLSGLEALTSTDNNLDVHIASQEAALEVVEGGYASWSVVAASVTNTESQLAAAPLSNRLKIEIQNLGSVDCYVRQSTGVSTSNGLKIPKGSSWEMGLDAGAAIYAITASGSADLRIAQYAA
jgi:hypothetical protein